MLWFVTAENYWNSLVRKIRSHEWHLAHSISPSQTLDCVFSWVQFARFPGASLLAVAFTPSKFCSGWCFHGLSKSSITSQNPAHAQNMPQIKGWIRKTSLFILIFSLSVLFLEIHMLCSQHCPTSLFQLAL